MKGVLLSELAACTGASVCGDYADFVLGNVSTDSRDIAAGDLFIALSGANFDGNDFIRMAAAKGACAILASRREETDVPLLLVPDTLKALQALAAFYRKRFSIPVIAVTGSNGKTTTKNMISTVLSGKYTVFSTDKNYNNHIGLPKSVLELDESHGAAVFEMGMNHPGEIRLLSEIARPDIAVITNIGKAHIGLLGSRENIFAAKMEITGGFSGADSCLILNSDDDLLRGVHDEYETLFAGSDGSYVAASDIKSERDCTRFNLRHDGKSVPCRLPVIGRHNVNNALLAVACGLKLGVSLDQAAAAIAHYTPSAMRGELSGVKGVTIIKDYYNASPESSKAALETLASYRTRGCRIAVLGQMLELGEHSAAEHEALARLCAGLCLDYVFFIGDDCEEFKRAMPYKSECFHSSERDALLRALKRNAAMLSEGGAVLIKGSRGVHMEEFYEALKSYINAEKSDFTALPPGPARLYVDIGAVKYNYTQIRNAVGTQVEIMPMVKANAYGCGTDIIANVFREARYLAVADVKEAALIRRILPEANIVVIYQPHYGDACEIAACGYITAISDIGFCARLSAASVREGVVSRVHIEVDSGMGRLGIAPEDAAAFAAELSKLENIEVEGIFTHYSSSDGQTDEDNEYTRRQTERFLKAVESIERVLGPVPYKHASCGAAIYNGNAAHFDMVRPGYMLYGYYPNEALREKVRLKPALKFVGVILQIKEHPAGSAIGYGRRFVTKRPSRIATVSVGYSDGVSRALSGGGCFVVNGQRAPVVGSVCMDLTMIDITDIEGGVAPGCEAAVFDNANVTVDEIAALCGTIGYEVIAQIEDKADRVESF